MTIKAYLPAMEILTQQLMRIYQNLQYEKYAVKVFSLFPTYDTSKRGMAI